LTKEESPWFRTPKTGKITDVFKRGSFYRWIRGILPWAGESSLSAKLRPFPALAYSSSPSNLSPIAYSLSTNPYLSLATSHNTFQNFRIRRRHIRGVGKIAIVFLLVFSLSIGSIAIKVPTVEAANFLLYFHRELASADTANYPNVSTAYQFRATSPDATSNEICGKYGKDAAGVLGNVPSGSACTAALPELEPSGGNGGNFYIAQSGIYPVMSASDPWKFDIRLRNPTVGSTAGSFYLFVKVFVYDGNSYSTVFYATYGSSVCTLTKPSGVTAITPSTTAYTISWTCTSYTGASGDGSVDMGVGNYLYIQPFIEIASASNSANASLAFVGEGSEVGSCTTEGTGCSKVKTTNFAVPESALIALPLIPFLPKAVQSLPALWNYVKGYMRNIRKRRRRK